MKNRSLEESFNYFINDIFNRCQTLDISANGIGTLIGEVVMLLHHIMPSKIPEFLDEKRKEIESSENETEQKREKLLQLDKEVTQVQNDLDSLLEREKTSIESIEWLSKIRQELKNEGIPVDEVEAFVQCIKGIKKKNYYKIRKNNKIFN